jgi:Lrp/AsnC family transcriptional regulator for asnA, asnC and gidA
MKTLKLDKIDKQISDLLIHDGRMSCAAIAKRIDGVSERAVRYRIERLIKNEIVQVHGNVNAGGLGYGVAADVFIEVDPSQVLEVANKIASHELVSYVACSTGERDISIQVFARSNAELYQYVTEILGKIEGVRRTKTSIVPLIVKDDHLWQIPVSCVSDHLLKEKSSKQKKPRK